MDILQLFPLDEQLDDGIRRIAPAARIHRCSRDDDAYERLLATAEIVVGWPPVDDLPRAERLRWLQLPSAGATRYARALGDGVILTNAAGVFGPVISEHIFAMMLALSRGVPAMVRAADRRAWRSPWQRRELDGAMCGIVGLGDIGTHVARRAKAFGMAVAAVRRRPGRGPAFVDELNGPESLGDLLAAADHVVVTLPGTRHTEGMLSRELLGRMRPTAFLYNVGRGATIDQDALVEMLRENRLAGAGLDVFAEEPLPPDSPLWEMENVIVSPHCSGATPKHADRLGEIFLDNLRRFVDAAPLRNQVDRHWEY